MSATPARPDESAGPATFGDLLQVCRLAAGWTQEELAERAHLSPHAISALERGARSRPRRETVRLLVNALQLEPVDRARLEAAARGADRSPWRAAGRVVLPDHPGVWHTLPIQLTSFIGRERELGEVKRLIRASRLVTLSGPSGCGKTRLAIQVAADLAGEFANGVSFVSLAALTDPSLVAAAIAHALGIVGLNGGSIRESLRRSLRDQELLLVLDECEAMARPPMIVADLLAGCPRLRVLATSQVVLRLSGEQEFRVSGLQRPDPGPLPLVDQLAEYDAIRLFVVRARAARVEFVLTRDNAASIAEICRRLDGIPLALELAAARVRILPPAALLARLATASGGLGVLAGGPEDRPARQQTLRQAITWSFALLEPPERTLLRRLSVFVGGCTLEAAEAICSTPRLSADPETQRRRDAAIGVSVSGAVGMEAPGEAVLSLLANLVDRSLVVVEEQADGTSRFKMLGTIREYALEQAREQGDADDLARRHCAYYLALAEAHEPLVHGADRDLGIQSLEAEQANLRAALEWSRANDPGARSAGRVAAALLWFWQFRDSSPDQPGWVDDARALAEATGRAPDSAEPIPRLPATRAPSGPTVLLALAIVALPGGILGWLIANPRYNLVLFVPNEHFVIVTTVALLALVVGLLVARVTVQIGHHRALFFALGFMAMAGFFVVHALATPGVLVDANLPGYGGPGGSAIEISSFLSIFVPAILFAASYVDLGPGFELRRRLPLGPGAPVIAVLVVLALYGVLAMSRPQDFARVVVSHPPTSYGLAAVSVLLLSFVAWRQARLFLVSQLPLPGAFVVAFVLLALAQLSMVLGPVWTLAWWEYHLLMYAAVILALGGIFFEYRQGRPLRYILEGALELGLDVGLDRERVDTVTALAAATELKDPHARGHTRRVAELVLELGRELEIPRDEWPALARAALLHDVGHLAIPDPVFLKKEPLTADEWEVMKEHAELGREILAGVGGLVRESAIIAAHHERIDGEGYPRGLAGDAIPRAARILAVADTFDALGMDRPYRTARPVDEALDLVQREAGTHLDPRVVATLTRVLGRRVRANASSVR